MPDHRLITHLYDAAALLSSAERFSLATIFRGTFATLTPEETAFLDRYEVSTLLAAYDTHPALTAVYDAPAELLALPRVTRAELVRQKLLAAETAQRAAMHDAIEHLIADAGVAGVTRLIDELTDLPIADGYRATMSPLDLPDAATSAQNRLARVLTAITLHHADPARRDDLVAFAIGMLAPHEEVLLSDISDVYGSEMDVAGSETDATRIRAREHWREIRARYGVSFDIVDQGTTIRCPEQCGFYALLGLNQARRAHRSNRMITTLPRFFLLNNASRTEENDGIEDGARDAKSSALLWFEIDLGDGIRHHGLAYGYRTLTHLRPYITRLLEIAGTDRGTQFRSLEFQKHLAAISAMTGGVPPLTHPVGEISLDTIPLLSLAVDRMQYLGHDKYGNGITNAEAEQVFARFLGAGQDSTRVIVTIFERDGKTVHIGPKIYTLARSLGMVRDGGNALWESSSPQTADPTRGFLSIGKFMQKPGEVNTDVLKIYPGCIIQIDALDTAVSE